MTRSPGTLPVSSRGSRSLNGMVIPGMNPTMSPCLMRTSWTSGRISRIWPWSGYTRVSLVLHPGRPSPTSRLSSPPERPRPAPICPTLASRCNLALTARVGPRSAIYSAVTPACCAFRSPYVSPKAHSCERFTGVPSLARRRASGRQKLARERVSQRWAADCTWATSPTKPRTKNSPSSSAGPEQSTMCASCATRPRVEHEALRLSRWPRTTTHRKQSASFTSIRWTGGLSSSTKRGPSRVVAISAAGVEGAVATAEVVAGASRVGSQHVTSYKLQVTSSELKRENVWRDVVSASKRARDLELGTWNL